MAKKKIYVHHERDTATNAKADAQNRELVVASEGNELIYKRNDGTYLRGKLNPDDNLEVWVEQFGAVGDGITYDTAKFNLAIAAVSTAGGGVVRMRSKNYLLGDIALVPKSNVTLLGCGMDSTYITVNGTWANFVPFCDLNGMSNFSVQGVTFKTTDALNQANWLFMCDQQGSADNIKMKSVRFDSIRRPAYLCSVTNFLADDIVHDSVSLNGSTAHTFLLLGCTYTIGKLRVTGRGTATNQSNAGAVYLHNGIKVKGNNGTINGVVATDISERGITTDSAFPEQHGSWQHFYFDGDGNIILNADLVTSNVVNGKINGTAISAVTFATSHANTMNLLAASINTTLTSLGVNARATQTGFGTRAIKIVLGKNSTTLLREVITLTNWAVTLGASQATATTYCYIPAVVSDKKKLLSNGSATMGVLWDFDNEAVPPVWLVQHQTPDRAGASVSPATAATAYTSPSYGDTISVTSGTGSAHLKKAPQVGVIRMTSTTYTSCVNGDVGLPVKDGSTTVGTLLSFDNDRREWYITQTSELIPGRSFTVFGGTGIGTSFPFHLDFITAPGQDGGRISNIKLDGSLFNANLSTGLSVDGMWNTTIENLEIKNFRYCGMFIGDSVNHGVSISNFDISYCTYGAWASSCVGMQFGNGNFHENRYAGLVIAAANNGSAEIADRTVLTNIVSNYNATEYTAGVIQANLVITSESPGHDATKNLKFTNCDFSKGYQRNAQIDVLSRDIEFVNCTFDDSYWESRFGSGYGVQLSNSSPLPYALGIKFLKCSMSSKTPAMSNQDYGVNIGASARKCLFDTCQMTNNKIGAYLDQSASATNVFVDIQTNIDPSVEQNGTGNSARATSPTLNTAATSTAGASPGLTASNTSSTGGVSVRVYGPTNTSVGLEPFTAAVEIINRNHDCSTDFVVIKNDGVAGNFNTANAGLFAIMNNAGGYVFRVKNAVVSITGDLSVSGTITGVASSSLTSAHMYVGNGSNVATDVAVSGDLTLANTGAFTIASNAVTTAKILDANVTLAKMANMATASLLGRNTAGTGVPEVLSASTAKTLLSLNNVENTALSTWAGTTSITTIGAATASSLASSGRLQLAKAANLASANNVTFLAANYAVVTGAVQMNLMESSGWTAGSRVTMQFASTPLIKHNQAASGTLKPFFLSPAVDYTAVTNSNVDFIFDGSFWMNVGKLP